MSQNAFDDLVAAYESKDPDLSVVLLVNRWNEEYDEAMSSRRGRLLMRLRLAWGMARFRWMEARP